VRASRTSPKCLSARTCIPVESRRPGYSPRPCIHRYGRFREHPVLQLFTESSCSRREEVQGFSPLARHSGAEPKARVFSPRPCIHRYGRFREHPVLRLFTESSCSRRNSRTARVLGLRVVMQAGKRRPASAERSEHTRIQRSGVLAANVAMNAGERREYRTFEFALVPAERAVAI
jgi:hypothetical protein